MGNGLTVILAHNDAVPIVTIEVWYKVGAKHENPDRLTAARGGTSNASTGNERTNYFWTFPKHQLETGVWLQSNIMGFTRGRGPQAASIFLGIGPKDP